MSVGSVSAAGLSQYTYSVGNSSEQQALLTLQNTLSSGSLTGAQSAFQSLETVLQNSATASGGSSSINSQLSQDLATLGSAINSADVSSAQSAFATVLGDLKDSPTAAQTNEAAAASQSLQLVNGLLGSLNSTSSSGTADDDSSLLQSYYAAKSGLDLLA
jgi:hypothetical protein